MGRIWPKLSRMIQIGKEVHDALEQRQAIVALESTVIAHGLPRPKNLALGRELERIVRDNGAIPATVAVLGGTPTVGLLDAELERLAATEGVMKLSTRDLPVATAKRADGATTVAATAWLAHRAGIAVFATGGIGGVHRGDLPDVSADLAELARTPMIVVCAGAKAILNLPATREALETGGVLVAGWRTDEFPAFYSRESGLGVDVRVDTTEEVAEVWRAHRRLDLPGALLLCAPLSAELAIPPREIEEAIQCALTDAVEAGVRGGEVTPFLLRRVADGTGGRALEANLALLRNNARVAAQVAVALAKL